MPASERFQKLLRRYPDHCGVAALLCLVLAVFFPFLTGRHLFFGDLELYYYPVSEFWRRSFSHGTLPLWNPQLFGGVSYVGNPQVVTLYPPDMLLWWLPTYTALGVSAMLHIWGSGSAFFLWARRGQLSLGAGAALLGAMCWMLGGAFVTKTQFPNMLSALAYLPAALWCAEGLAHRPGLRSAAALGAVLALQLLAAHAQISFLTIYFAFIYCASVWWKSPNRSLSKTLASWGLALGFAALLDAGQLLPVAETLRGAERQLLSLHEAERFYLPVWAVTNLFAPYLYGNPNHGTWTNHGGGTAWETACYLGILPFLLAMWGWKKGRFWAVWALVCLVLAMGISGGLFPLAYRIMPGLSRFHNAARFLMPGAVGLAVLAALGFQKFQVQPKMGRFAPVVLALCALDLGLYAHSFYPLRTDAQMAYPAPHFIAADPILGNGQGRIWCANPRQARGLLIHYEDYTRRTPQHDALFPVGSIPDTQMWSGQLEAEGYDPIAPVVVATRLKALQIDTSARTFPPGYARRLSEAGIRLLVLWRQTPLPAAPELTPVYHDERQVDGMQLTIYRNEDFQGRAAVAAANAMWQWPVVTQSSPNTLEVHLRGQRPLGNTLRIFDNDAPGWRAYQDGKAAALKPTSNGFLEVGLNRESKVGTVRLVYDPQSYRFGVFVTLCALGMVTGVFFATKKPETK